MLSSTHQMLIGCKTNNITPALLLDDLPPYMFSFNMGFALQTLLDPEIIPEDAYNPAMRRLLG